jgi:ABC-type transporter Mla subunit MlaD
VSEATNDLLLEVMRRIQSDIGDLKRDVREVKARLSAQDDHIRGVITSIGILTDKTDNMADRMERIEKRLGLVDA